MATRLPIAVGVVVLLGVALAGALMASGPPSAADEFGAVDADDSVDGDRLVATHARQLRGRTFRVDATYHGPWPGSDVAVPVDRHRSLKRGTDQSLIVADARWANGSRHYWDQLYYDGDTWYRQLDDGESVDYVRIPGGPLHSKHSSVTDYRLLGRYLDAAATLRSEGVVSSNDGVRYRIEGRGVASGSWLANASDYQVTLLVGPDGTIRQCSVSYTRTVDESRLRATLDWQLGFGEPVSVAPPEWYPEAVTTTTPADSPGS